MRLAKGPGGTPCGVDAPKQDFVDSRANFLPGAPFPGYALVVILVPVIVSVVSCSAASAIQAPPACPKLRHTPGCLEVSLGLTGFIGFRTHGVLISS